MIFTMSGCYALDDVKSLKGETVSGQMCNEKQTITGDKRIGEYGLYSIAGLSYIDSKQIIKGMEVFVELARERGLSDNEIILLCAELNKMLITNHDTKQLVVTIKQTTGFDVLKWGVCVAVLAVAVYAIIKMLHEKKDEEPVLKVKRNGNQWVVGASSEQVAEIISKVFRDLANEQFLPERQ